MTAAHSSPSLRRDPWRCPGCGSDKGREKHRISSAESAVSFVRPWVDPERHARLVECIDALWRSNEARIMECSDCALRTADPFVAGTPEFYELAFGSNSVHSYPGWRWEYQLTKELVKASNGTVLELGGGQGAFQRGLIADGVEPSRLFVTEYSTKGRQSLEQLGVEVCGLDFRELPPASHAVVCAHQVFEHLDDIDGAFDAFEALTAEDGAVALSTPNGVNTIRLEDAGGEFDMPPTHISTWQYSAFHAAARRRGWKVAEYREEPVSRFEAARYLAVSRAMRSRQSKGTVTAAFERLAPSPQARYGLMAISAAAHFPSAYLTSRDRHGWAIWVLLKRI